MDPLQFTYRAGRGVDDAKKLIMGAEHKNLEHPNTTAILLFAGLSSAFNTLQPHILAEKLSTRFHLDHQLILWIPGFLTNRSRRVLVNNTFSDVSVTSTGSPQGCVHSPTPFMQMTQFSCPCSQATNITTAQCCKSMGSGVINGSWCSTRRRPKRWW